MRVRKVRTHSRKNTLCQTCSLSNKAMGFFGTLSKTDNKTRMEPLRQLHYRMFLGLCSVDTNNVRIPLDNHDPEE